MNLILGLLLFLSTASGGPQDDLTIYYNTGERQAVFVTTGNSTSALYFYKDGTIQETGTIVNFTSHGIWRSYNPEGSQIAEAVYDNGLKVGNWKFWYDSGAPKSELIYNNNVLISAQEWSEKGELVSAR